MDAKLVVVLLAVAIAGCVASGPLYPEQRGLVADVPPHAARITVFRRASDTVFLGRPVPVAIDGRTRASCDYAGYAMVDVTKGPHVLRIDIPDYPGRCELAVDLIGGEEYFYALVPRESSYRAWALGSLVGFFVPLGGAAGLVAMAAESADKTCGGPFAIVPVDEDVALQALRTLRESR